MNPPDAHELCPFRFRWVLVGALLIALAYLPTLGTRFDFIDDGNLVYPSPALSPGARIALVWQKIVANYEHLGPFRPVLWVHWEVQADLFGGRELLWRVSRWVWIGLTAGLFLALLRELRLRLLAALPVVALALWNPYRGEIWTSLTLSEGVAAPYALFALWAAVRAQRSPHPWRWDVAGAVAVLAALGCKNTFAALVPAQIILRMAPGVSSLREGLARHGKQVALLCLPLLLPMGHFVVFRLGWRPGQYEMRPISGTQLIAELHSLAGALSLDFLGLGWGLTLLALVQGGRLSGWPRRHWTGILAGVTLIVTGLLIYLPMNAISGRYTIPAVWGADILLAFLLHELLELPATAWRRAAQMALVAGLAAVLVACLGRQDRFAARAKILWQALEEVERTAPQGACLEWVVGPDLNQEEGIHFCWHLQRRGRADLTVRLVDSLGHPLERRELATETGVPWRQLQGGKAPATFHVPYRAGLRHYDLTLCLPSGQRVHSGDLSDG